MERQADRTRGRKRKREREREKEREREAFDEIHCGVNTANWKKSLLKTPRLTTEYEIKRIKIFLLLINLHS